MEIDKKQLRIAAITYGLVLGAALTILGIVSFYIIINTSSAIIVSIVPFLFAVVLPLALIILLCFNLRKQIGGYWGLRQAATGIFIMFFTAFAVQFIVRDQIFARVIEPNMVQKTKAAMINVVSSVLKKSKASKAAINEKMGNIEKQFDSQKDLSISKQIQGVAIAIIFMFVLAIIFAAFFKKEEQIVYVPSVDDETKV